MITKEEASRLIRIGRDFMHMPEEDPEYNSDQYSDVPAPPLFKDPVSDVIIDLPMDFDSLKADTPLLDIVNRRSSHRVYTEEYISLLQLSYLLWCAQGVKGKRGKNYCTLRTVPCGGSPHEFDVHFAVQYVEGLKPRYYHYLPEHHQIEFLGEESDIRSFIDESVAKQTWAVKASVVFYFDMVAYRAEWRYGIYTHRVALMDLGYISENIYLASEVLGLGSCALGSISEGIANEKFGLDGSEEFILLAHPVGTIKEADRQKELDFYAFVHDYDK